MNRLNDNYAWVLQGFRMDYVELNGFKNQNNYSVVKLPGPVICVFLGSLKTNANIPPSSRKNIPQQAVPIPAAAAKTPPITC